MTTLGQNWLIFSNHLTTNFAADKTKAIEEHFLKINNSCKCNPPMMQLLLLRSQWRPRFTILSFEKLMNCSQMDDFTTSSDLIRFGVNVAEQELV